MKYTLTTFLVFNILMNLSAVVYPNSCYDDIIYAYHRAKNKKLTTHSSDEICIINKKYGKE